MITELATKAYDYKNLEQEERGPLVRLPEITISIEGIRPLFSYSPFNPETGRFLSEDPIGFAGLDENLYRYVFNNPSNFTDSSGQILPLLGAVAFGAAFGGITSLITTYQIVDDVSLREAVQSFTIGAIGGAATVITLATSTVIGTVAAIPIGIGGALIAAYGILDADIAQQVNAFNRKQIIDKQLSGEVCE